MMKKNKKPSQPKHTHVFRLVHQDQVEKVLQKQTSMQDMFDKRRVSLKKLAAKQTRPVQPVAPRPEAFIKSPLSSPGQCALLDHAFTHVHKDMMLLPAKNNPLFASCIFIIVLKRNTNFNISCLALVQNYA